jgi:putative hydrolase of HD superfamily
MERDVKHIIERLINLQEKYSFVKRHMVTADRYEQIHQAGLISKGDYNHLALREPLMEHVGHLPILAAFLHPYIEHSKEVDLGRVLTMLAVHDIGETEVGDVFAYDKTDEDADVEFRAALKLLEPEQQEIYKEYEARESLESKYAKSIDALAPVIHSMCRPQVKIDHFKTKGCTVQTVVDNKTKYFEWDNVLKELFSICLDHYLKIEKAEEGLFEVKG